VPLVSGLNSIEAKTEAAARVVPIIIGIAKPMCHSVVARWPPADAEPNYFRLGNFGPVTRDYSGVTIKLDSAARQRPGIRRRLDIPD
jgi:hypothetical protein